MTNLTIEEAEAAWLAALTTPTTDAMQALLHSEFLAVHGPVGYMHDVQQMLADAAARGPAHEVEMIDVRIRHFGDTAIVSGLQEMHIAFEPNLPPFAIQAAVTARVGPDRRPVAARAPADGAPLPARVSSVV